MFSLRIFLHVFLSDFLESSVFVLLPFLRASSVGKSASGNAYEVIANANRIARNKSTRRISRGILGYLKWRTSLELERYRACRDKNGNVESQKEQACAVDKYRTVDSDDICDRRHPKPRHEVHSLVNTSQSAGN